MLNPERAEYEFWTYELPLSVEPEEMPLNVSIYPNPANDFVFVQTGASGLQDYTLINSSGAIVDNGALVNNKIDVSLLETGIYFVQIHFENGQSVTEKLVIR